MLDSEEAVALGGLDVPAAAASKADYSGGIDLKASPMSIPRDLFLKYAIT